MINKNINTIKNEIIPNKGQHLDKSIINEERSTKDKTGNEKQPEFYSKDKIIVKLLDDTIKDKFNNSNIEKSNEYYFLKEKTKRRMLEDDFTGVIIEKPKKKKRGRQSKSTSIYEHNKMSSDNIIKKIKAKIFKYILIFLNNLLEKAKKIKGNIKFFKLDYEYILKVSFEKELLSMKLKDLVSLNISPKYKGKEENNKKIIDSIENKDVNIINEEYIDTLIFIINITLRDWLDLFTGKKIIEDFDVLAVIKKENEVPHINFKMIKDNFLGINDLLNNFKEEEDEYFAHFVFLLFNYERWFNNKRTREKKNKNNDI